MVLIFNTQRGVLTSTPRSRLSRANSMCLDIYTMYQEPQQYISKPTISYDVEAKCSVKPMLRAGEFDLYVWNHVLQLKTAETYANKCWGEDMTKLVQVVTGRKTGKVTS